MSRVFIIAEAGVNHNGNVDIAYKLIDAAVAARADAVKFQTFKAEKLVSKTARKAEYQIRNTPNGDVTQLGMLKELELEFQDYVKLKEYCDRVGIQFLTTPFDLESADLIFDLVSLYKVPSGEIINLPFLKHIAKKGKPIILSTGMSTLGEVETAVDVVTNEQPETASEFSRLSLLHCTTNYPCTFDEVNLKAMLTLRQAFQVPVGYSDHSMGIEVPIAAVSLGATIIEKHFTLDRTMSGPDHQASLEPSDLGQMIKAIRNIETALGNGIKKPNQSELKIMQVVRKSLVVRQDLAAGSILSAGMLAYKRPGNGISPTDLSKAMGRILKKDKAADEVVTWDDLRDE